MQLTNKEIEVIDKLGECWNDFVELCKENPKSTHPQDCREFCSLIHKLQEKVMSRLAVRAHPKKFNNKGG